MAVAILAALVAMVGPFNSGAVQNASISIDMVTAGNTYDETTNSMTVGTIDNCLTTAVGGNLMHNHTTHLIIQNVEDLIAWQVRFNYLGDQMRPSTFSGTPFTDNTTGDAIGFVNLPIDTTTGQHRGVVPASAIPTAAPGPQTALIGAVYGEAQNFAISPDTPAKVPAEVPAPNYSTTGGGILAT